MTNKERAVSKLKKARLSCPVTKSNTLLSRLTQLTTKCQVKFGHFTKRHKQPVMAGIVGVLTIAVGFSAGPEHRTEGIRDGMEVIGMILLWPKNGPKDPPDKKS